ncbi:MAG TPA: hypothetical protein VGO47_04545 [Chlamydiales bacterium]|nr:hypothetical protein [Chlamydiales bacterium]
MRPHTPDIESVDSLVFSDTPSNIRASSSELSGIHWSGSTPQAPEQGILGREGPSALSIMISRNNSKSPPKEDLEQTAVADGDRPESNPEAANGAPVYAHETNLIPVETTPLILKDHPLNHDSFMLPLKGKLPFQQTLSQVISWHAVLHSLPAVVLGLLLNILDGLSYGLIIFPATAPFESFGSTGASMFFVTYVQHIQ